ncbi:hypothetical protein ACN28E_11790 [Archangium lansingense]|uniref:hypothetical protein n=1 Tax=Archangium lansingense TaxID=2995310 RepID=UPI003B790D0F
MRSLLSYMDVAREFLVETSEKFDPRSPWEARFESYRTFCLALKMLAYGKLLAQSDVPGFFLDLLRSAASWKQMLAHLREEGSPYQIPASMNDSLLGAIVCCHMELAREIAELSAREPTSPEYDDEFYGAFFLQEYVCSRFGQARDTARLQDICQRIDDYLGEQTSRTSVYRALAEKDWVAFEVSFKDWNEVTAAELSDPNAPGATFSTGITRHIWLEGVAILQLAREAGCPLATDLRPLIPEMVLRPAPALPKDGNLWLLGTVRLREEDV